ncbi:MAG: DUF3179 domain-containing protein [Gammaproteobacteria bacterium]|nr:DUF3179 domain-containing protein [Gammaproteobacteria bacterium]
MKNKLTLRLLIFYPFTFIFVSLFFKEQLVSASSGFNGFDLSNSLINTSEIHHGGPAKDGIPSLDSPKFIKASQAGYLSNNDRVLGVHLNGQSKAYPIKILNYHEIVNDYFPDVLSTDSSKSVVITYCPLCGSGVAYHAKINGKDHQFGVSGLLYNSDVLLYDRETESLWSQLLSKGISGQYKGVELELLPMSHTNWKTWKKEHPETLVLSEKTGFSRNYSTSPYGSYDKSKLLYFPVNKLNSLYHPKEYVLGLKILGKTKVYPFAELSKISSPYQDTFSGHKVTIIFNVTNRTGKILDSQGKEIPTITSFWFAWMGFYPESYVFKALP